MTLEVKSHSLLSGIFQTGMGLQRKKMFFSSKELLLYTVGKFIENRANNNKRVGSKN